MMSIDLFCSMSSEQMNHYFLVFVRKMKTVKGKTFFFWQPFWFQCIEMIKKRLLLLFLSQKEYEWKYEIENGLRIINFSRSKHDTISNLFVGLFSFHLPASLHCSKSLRHTITLCVPRERLFEHLFIHSQKRIIFWCLRTA
jgi:hypothetical protein